MKKNRNRRVVPILFTLASAVIVAGIGGEPSSPGDVDAFVAKGVLAWRVPGLAVAVVKDGAVVFAKGYGVRELGKPEPVDTHTLFAIGSTTKAMTAAAVGMLVDEKKVAWDDPVVKHLPSLQFKDPYVTRELTVRDLLTHRGGLGNADFLWYGQGHSPQDILRRVRLLDPAYSLRSGFIYQNIMYAAAGAVVEAASGMPWDRFVQTRIFDPLGMRDTIPHSPNSPYSPHSPLPSQPNVASPHFVIDGTVRVIENASVEGVAPAGSVWSSVNDMAKWMQFLLDDGRIGGANGKRLLSEATIAELFKPQTLVGSDAFYPTARLTRPHWTTYGLGWFQEDYQGQAVDFHTGSIDGMVAIHGLLRDQRLGVYVLGNLDHAELRHAIMYTVFDRYAGRTDHDWSAELLKLYGGLQKDAETAQKKQDAQRVTGTSPSLPLARYAGTYSDPLYGMAAVTIEKAALRIRYGSAFAGALEHWHYDTFRVKWAAEWRGSALVSFALDPQGRPHALELMGARFTREEEK